MLSFILLATDSFSQDTRLPTPTTPSVLTLPTILQVPTIEQGRVPSQRGLKETREGEIKMTPLEEGVYEEKPLPLTPRETTDFERYLSERLDIKEEQLDILRLQPQIKFSSTPIKPLPSGYLMYYLPIELGGGFIYGTPEALSEAFKIAGIESHLYISTELNQFGYKMFERPPSTFAPGDMIPVSPDYILGPGDELRIAIWGKINGEYNVTIDRDGKVSLPTVGVLHLAGLTFQEAKGSIQKEYSRYYKDLNINISMGSLRSITVYMVGKARRPGSYTLSSLSTLVNALFAAGGPSKVGTMRDIQIKRNGEVVVSLDMYDFILKGDKTKDIRLLPEDVIFIPPVGPLVAVAGNVKEPAIYELKGEAKILDLIEIAGGTDSIAFKNRVQVLKIVNGGEQELLEMDLSGISEDSEGNITLKDGDLVKVFPVPQSIENVVHITGAVKSPGTFGYSPGMTVKELLSYTGGLLRYSNREEAELTRINITPLGPQMERIVINPQKAIDGDPQHDILLKVDDYLFIKTVPEWEFYRVVTIKGEVKYPGTYTVKKGERISSLIERAGGFTEEAYLRGAVFTRKSVRELQQRQLDEAINRLEQEFLSLSARTVEAALSQEEVQQQMAAAERRKDLLAKMRTAKAQGKISIKLEPLKRFKDSPYDIPLEDSDSLYIPERPDQIQVIGAVYNPSSFVYDPQGRVASYIKKAGGFNRNAEEDDLYILRLDGTAISRREAEGFLSISWDNENKRWQTGGFMGARLEPGDTLVVPEKVERVVWLREVKDITQILYQIAVTAGVLIVAF